MINTVIGKQANKKRVQTIPTVQMKIDFLQEKLKKESQIMKRCYFTYFIELSGNLEMPYSCVQKKRKENFYNICKLPLNLTVQNLWEHMLSRFVFEKNIFIHLHVYKHLNLNFISDFVSCLCSDSHCDLHTQGELEHAVKMFRKKQKQRS